MTRKQLREHLGSRPFHSFVLRTVSGARHPVPHPDYLFIPPLGDTVLVVDKEGTMHHIGIDHIKAVETRARTAKPKAS